MNRSLVLFLQLVWLVPAAVIFSGWSARSGSLLMLGMGLAAGLSLSGSI